MTQQPKYPSINEWIKKCSVFTGEILFGHKKTMKCWFLLQHEWTLEILCRVKEASLKRPHVVLLYLHETSRRKGKSETGTRRTVA